MVRFLILNVADHVRYAALRIRKSAVTFLLGKGW